MRLSTGWRCGMLGALLACLIGWVGGRAAAQAPVQALVTWAVVPAASPGFVEIDAVVVEAELTCEGISCQVSVAQRYQLHNRDRVKPAALRIKLARPSPDATFEGPYQISFKGAPFAPWDEAATGDVALSPNEQGTLEVRSRHSATAGSFVEWAWDMSVLSSWGQIVSARVVWKMPAQITEDAFLAIQPPPASFDGHIFVWEFEALTAPPRFDIAMIAPPAWEELHTLAASGDHLALAKRYLALKEEANRRGLAYPDPFGKVLAELQLALTNESTRGEAHTLLADLYRRRAEAVPELRLNYLVLAAREYEALYVLQPGSAEVARRLSQTLFDAALTASEEGDPAGALEYLRKAQEVDALALPPGDVERLMLKWAVELAQGGRAWQALEELKGTLTPGVEQGLFRYAPPIRWARTEVSLKEGERTVTYFLGSYEPSSARTLERLQALAARLGEIPNCRVEIRPLAENASFEMTIQVRWGGLEELRATSAEIAKACAADDGFFAALIAAPWRTELAQYGVWPIGWASEWRYEEEVNLTEVASAWEAEATYSHWHLIETRNEAPLDERSALEKQLALAVLSDQAHTWDGLPTACVWAYHISVPGGQGNEVLSWLVSWGEMERLTGGQSASLWKAAALLAGGVACALGIAGLVRAFRRRT